MMIKLFKIIGIALEDVDGLLTVDGGFLQILQRN